MNLLHISKQLGNLLLKLLVYHRLMSKIAQVLKGINIVKVLHRRELEGLV